MEEITPYKEIVNNLTQNIYIKDTNSEYLFCNRAYAALLGIAPDEIIGKSDFDLFPEETAQRYRDDDQMVLAENRTLDVNEEMYIDGERKLIRTIKNPLVVDGQTVGVLTAFWEVTHVYEREQELNEIKAGLIEAQELAHIGHWDLNLERNTLYWSDEVYRIFGLEPQEFGATYDAFLNHVHPDDIEMVNEAYTASVAKKSSYQINHRVIRKDGEQRYVEERCHHEFDKEGNVIRSVGTVHDITEQRLAQENLQLMAKVVANTTNGVMITDPDRNIIYVNESLCRISGYSVEELQGERPSVLSSGWHDTLFYTNMWESIENTGAWQGEVRDRKKDGELYIAELSIFVLKNEQGQVTNYIAITDDITEKKEKEELIHNLAYFDSLTDLPNRVLFKQKFEAAIRKAERDDDRCALLFFDLDNFKNINDTLGHLIGDKLLKQVAQRLQQMLPEEYALCRLGGDEFTVIIDKMDNPYDIAHIAEKINESIARPFVVDGSDLYIGVSIGISLYPSDGKDYDALLKAADTAMYHVKDTGKSSFQFFTDELNQATTERLIIENELRNATARNEMYLVYQPKIDLAAGSVYGMEALLRWENPKLGFVPPDKFIPIAEETGLINQIGAWVSIKAMSDTRRLHGMGFEGLVVSINVSSVQLGQENFVSTFISGLIHTEIDKTKVEIEITESSLMKQVEAAMEKLYLLDNHGIKLSIDDFGTGYSSLSYLKKMPVQTLKIDRTFIDDITHDEDDRSITSSIISLAKNMGMDTIAEGTESKEQVEILKQMGCTKVQGYFYSKPLPFDDFIAFIRDFNGSAL